MKIPKPRKLPSGKWNISMSLGGENVSITRPAKEECIHEAEQIKAKYRAGKWAKTPSCDMTIEEILELYIKEKSKVLSPSTICEYKSIQSNRFQSIKKKKPSAIKDWQSVIDNEMKDGIKAKTVRNAWGLLSPALERVGYPVPKVTLPKVASSTRPWLDPEQVRVFIDAVHGHPCEVPALLALHGLRRSEILGLTWDKVDLKTGMIRVEGSAVIGDGGKLVFKETNKTKKSRRVVPIMIPELKDALESVPEKNRVGLVYAKTPTLIWEQINLICEKHGLPKPGVHGLRHSFASIALHVGMSQQETMLIGGWEDSGTMNKIYQHISDADKLKAENKLKEFFKKPV